VESRFESNGANETRRLLRQALSRAGLFIEEPGWFETQDGGGAWREIHGVAWLTQHCLENRTESN